MKTLYVRSRKQWREWLEKNHDKEKEIWLVYYRKTSGKPTVSYDESVEEALCFGWIDSKEKSLDSERYAGRFTPRKPKSNWSPSNRARAKRLIESKQITDAGRKALPKDL
ncbi:MAG: hypothetical protein HYW63_04455 [Candidatus Levybacteria bacterium]|nr:hypothetical protein [Candidatus Levybacteria bacterium]